MSKDEINNKDTKIMSKDEIKHELIEISIKLSNKIDCLRGSIHEKKGNHADLVRIALTLDKEIKADEKEIALRQKRLDILDKDIEQY